MTKKVKITVPTITGSGSVSPIAGQKKHKSISGKSMVKGVNADVRSNSITAEGERGSMREYVQDAILEMNPRWYWDFRWTGQSTLYSDYEGTQLAKPGEEVYHIKSLSGGAPMRVESSFLKGPVWNGTRLEFRGDSRLEGAIDNPIGGGTGNASSVVVRTSAWQGDGLSSPFGGDGTGNRYDVVASAAGDRRWFQNNGSQGLMVSGDDAADFATHCFNYYPDGREYYREGELYTAFQPANNDNTTDVFCIGSYQVNRARFLEGDMAVFVVFDRALDAEEAKRIHDLCSVEVG